MGDLLILTGPPGTGKTTTARGVVTHLAERCVHIHADDFWRAIRSGAIPPQRASAHQQNIVVMEAIAAAAGAYAKGGFVVLVDGIVGPWFLGPFTLLGVRLHYVILRATLATTLERARGRDDRMAIASRPIGELHAQFSALGSLERHVIDTSTHSAEATCSAVLRAFRSGEFQLRDAAPSAN